MTLEQTIASALDGTFTRLRDDGGIEVKTVPKSYIPPYHMQAEAREAGRRAAADAGRERQRRYRRSWSPDQEATLIAMHRAGHTQIEMMEALGRSKTPLQVKIHELRAKGLLQ